MTGQDETSTKGRGKVLVVALVLLFLLGSCVKNSWDDRQRDKRAEKQGGGTVLVEAPTKTCWYLTAYDERLPDGRPGEDEGDLSSSEAEDLEAAGGKFEKEACGPAEVTLPPAVVYGSVSLFVGDENDRHNYAAWLWLTSKRVPRGGAVSVDGGYVDGYENDTAVFAAAAGKVYNSDGWSGDVVSKKPFGPASATQFDPDNDAHLRKAGIDTDVFTADLAAAAAKLMSSKSADVDEARAGLKKVAALVAAALDANSIVFTATNNVGRKASATTLGALTRMEKNGGTVAAQVPALRKWLAGRLLANIRPDYDDSDVYADAAKAVPALNSIDPSQSARWNSLAKEWEATATRLKAAEKAQEARDAAELNSQLTSPSTGGSYPGCDGDGDGICNE